MVARGEVAERVNRRESDSGVRTWIHARRHSMILYELPQFALQLFLSLPSQFVAVKHT